MNAKKILIGLALGGAALGLFYLVVSAGESEEKKAALSQEEELRARMSAPGGNNLNDHDFGPLTPGQLRGLIGKVSAPNKEALRRHYELYYRYPPDSRPLTEKMVDLLEPNKMESSRFKAYKRGNDPKTGSPDYYFQITGPSRLVFGEQPILFRFRAWKAGTDETVKPNFKEARIRSDFKSGRQPLADVEFRDDGQNGDRRAGDGTWSYQWEHPGEGRKYWGELNIYVIFTLPDTKELKLELPFFATPKPPARFTGEFEEKLEDGSLVIYAGLQVDKKGHYIIEANLERQSDGKPCCYAYQNGPLETGEQAVRLVFFGKIFHDKELEGKFRLTDLRGYRQNNPFELKDMAKIATGELKVKPQEEPQKEMVKPWYEEYVTGEYSLRDFSPEEFDSPQKQDTLDGLK